MFSGKHKPFLPEQGTFLTKSAKCQTQICWILVEITKKPPEDQEAFLLISIKQLTYPHDFIYRYPLHIYKYSVLLRH